MAGQTAFIEHRRSGRGGRLKRNLHQLAYNVLRISAAPFIAAN
jgi:hypothetical protein